MAYTAEEQDVAVNAFIQQLENIRGENVASAIISPVANPNFLIDYNEGDLQIICRNFPFDVNVPDWMRLERHERNLTITCSEIEYKSEMIYFVMHVWRTYKIELEKPRAEQQPLDQIIRDAFGLLHLRWSGVREPKSVKEQKGLIGELEALRSAIADFGEGVIIGWDASGHAHHDITTEVLDIEAKSKSPQSNHVTISSIDQLQLNDEKELYLSVTDVAVNRDGITLPAYKEQFLIELQEAEVQRVRAVEILIESWGLTEGISDLFHTRFIVGETTRIRVQAEHACNLLPNLNIPDGVQLGGYKLDIRTLN